MKSKVNKFVISFSEIKGTINFSCTKEMITAKASSVVHISKITSQTKKKIRKDKK